MLRSRLILLAAVAVLTGCTSMQLPTQPATGADHEATIAMTAISYDFIPNNLNAQHGDTLHLEIHNAASKHHNFTLKFPGGETLTSVDLPPGETRSVTVTLSQRGEYRFHCDMMFHPLLGMKGTITVE